MDEKGLVRRCRAGDQAAKQEMYETYAGRLLAVCRRYVREPERARDLVHDTFLKAWESLDGFRPRRAGSLGAWLSQIAAHLAVDELRSRKPLVWLEEEGPLEEAPVDAERLREVFFPVAAYDRVQEVFAPHG